MNFMYLGAVDVEENYIESVLKAAKDLRIKGFYEAESLTPNNFKENNQESSIVQRKVKKELTPSYEVNIDNDKNVDRDQMESSKESESVIEQFLLDGERLDQFSREKELQELKKKTEKNMFSYKIRNKPFKCTICELSYASQGALLNHKKGKHEGILFYCELEDCNFSASQAGNLRTHIMSKHSES